MRIFHYTGKRTVCHHKPAISTTPKPMGKKAESIGITLKMSDVRPEVWRHHCLKSPTRTFEEVGLYGSLATMSEGRISHIMCKTRCRDNSSYLLKQCSSKLRMSFHQGSWHIITQRPSHARHFERVGQPVMNKDTSRQWEHLGLILHPSEWCREYQSVIVALELWTVVMSFRMNNLLSESFVGYQFLPVHCDFVTLSIAKLPKSFRFTYYLR